MSRIPVPVRAGGVVLAATLLLSGCAGLRPGTAVEVGDEQITTSEIDAVTTQFCAALEEPLDQQAQTIPHSYFRGGIAGVLAMREVASQVAADFGVEADSEEYRQQLADLREQIATLPESQQEAVVQVEGSPFYVQAVQTAVGEELLGGEGDASAFEQAGAEEMQRWIDENGVEFDPVAQHHDPRRAGRPGRLLALVRGQRGRQGRPGAAAQLRARRPAPRRPALRPLASRAWPAATRSCWSSSR